MRHPLFWCIFWVCLGIALMVILITIAIVFAVSTTHPQATFCAVPQAAALVDDPHAAAVLCGAKNLARNPAQAVDAVVRAGTKRVRAALKGRPAWLGSGGTMRVERNGAMTFEYKIGGDARACAACFVPGSKHG